MRLRPAASGTERLCALGAIGRMCAALDFTVSCHDDTLVRAADSEQESRVGNQTGGRVFLFLHTDDFWRDYNCYVAKGVRFVRTPSEERHGTVAVFRDLYGNLWDLVQPKDASSAGDFLQAVRAAREARCSEPRPPD